MRMCTFGIVPCQTSNAFHVRVCILQGFTLLFHFSPNAYFSNSQLSKEYTLKFYPDDTDAFDYDGPEVVACKG